MLLAHGMKDASDLYRYTVPVSFNDGEMLFGSAFRGVGIQDFKWF